MGLIRLYKLNETSGTVATESFGNHGTYARDASNTTYTGSSPGTAIVRGQDFNGSSDCVSIPTVTEFVNLTGFSWSVWFRSDQSSGPLLGTTGTDNPTVRKRDNTSFAVIHTAQDEWTTSSIGTSGWNNLVGTRSAANLMRLYLNGVESSTSGIIKGGPFQFKRIGLQNATFYDGKIAYIKLFNHELSFSEIQTLYAERNSLIVNQPVITSNGGGSTASVSADENQISVTTVTITGGGGTAAYSITGGADSAKFSINSSGVLTFVSAPDYEVPTDSNADGVYEVGVGVTTPDGTDSQLISVTVADLPDGILHRLTGNAPLAMHFSTIDRNYCDRATSNITGITFGHCRNLTIAGTGVVAFTASGKTIRYTAPGDTAGTPLALTADLRAIKLYSGNGVDWIYIDVTYASLPVGDQSDNITIINIRTTGVEQPTEVTDAGDPDYASQSYYWDFDDPYAITYSLTNNHDSNHCWGSPNTAHLYTRPGTYYPTVDIWTSDGERHRHTLTVTVSDQEATATIYYVDSVSGNNGNSGLTPASPLQTIAAAWAKIVSNNVIIKLKRGGTYAIASTNTAAYSHITVTSYYNADGSDDTNQSRPQITTAMSSGDLFNCSPGISDLKLCHLNFVGPGSGTARVMYPGNGTTSVSNPLIYDCTITDFHIGVGHSGSANSAGDSGVCVIHCDILGFDNAGFASGGNGMYLGLLKGMILGTRVNNRKSGEHCMRIFTHDEAIIADSYFTDPAATKVALNIRGGAYGTIISTGKRWTANQYSAILRCQSHVGGSVAQLCLQIAPTNDSVDERIEHIIVDGCYFTSGLQSQMAILMGRDIFIRNTVCRTEGSIIFSCTNEEANVWNTARSDRLRLYNNTAISDYVGQTAIFLYLLGQAASTKFDPVGIKIKNCIWYKSGVADFYLWTGGRIEVDEVDSDYNLCEIGGAAIAWSYCQTDASGSIERTLAQSQAALKELHSFNGTANFTNEAGADYTLASNSNAIGIGGDTLVSWARFDKAGNLRTTNISAGAYEYNYSIWPIPTVDDGMGNQDIVFKINSTGTIYLSLGVVADNSPDGQPFGKIGHVDFSALDQYINRFHRRQL